MVFVINVLAVASSTEGIIQFQDYIFNFHALLNVRKKTASCRNLLRESVIFYSRMLQKIQKKRTF